MPHLSKGEMAEGIKARAEASIQSVRRRVEIFALLKSEEVPQAHLLEKFSSVATLASWKDICNGIVPVSPKTLRKHIQEFYPGGLRQLRKDADQLIKQDNDKLASDGDNNKLWRYEAEQAVDSTLEMTTRYLDILERLKRLASENEKAEAELQRHLSRYHHHPHIKEIK